MRSVFVDTWFYLALLDASDKHHFEAAAFLRSFTGIAVTTRWVLTETANGLSVPPFRQRASKLLDRIEKQKNVRVIADSDAWYQRGLALYAARPDKGWSLIDCISFVVMENEGLREALTGDRHFSQAGFVRVFED